MRSGSLKGWGINDRGDGWRGGNLSSDQFEDELKSEAVPDVTAKQANAP
jgi:hypothetical protein